MLNLADTRNRSRRIIILGVAILAFFTSTTSLFHPTEPNLESSGHNEEIFLVESECWNTLDRLRKQQKTGYWARSATCFFDKTLNKHSGAWVIRPA